MDQDIPVIYIPLNRINQNINLNDYLEKNVCRWDKGVINELRDLMVNKNSSDQYLVLILDGVNEISLAYDNKASKSVVQSFIDTIYGEYFNSFKGVEIIFTSRSDDEFIFNKIDDKLLKLKLLPFESERIQKYLTSQGIDGKIDKDLIKILTTPLLMTIYTSIDKFLQDNTISEKEKRNIGFFDNPSTVGNLIGNFFKSQILKAMQMGSYVQEYYVILEYLLPLLAYKMFEDNNSFVLDQDDANYEVYYNIPKDSRYTYFECYRLSKVVDTDIGFNFRILLNLSVNNLSFLREIEGGYEFVNQDFRDYFIAYFLASELQAINKKEKIAKERDLAIENFIYPNEILSYLSDIMNEEINRPIFKNNEWFFPGKNEDDLLSPSKDSILEKSLNLRRSKEGEKAQNATANIVNAMKIGRDNLLFPCDFSNLDLRSTKLNKIKFVDWACDKFYPSKFDNSFIDSENLIRKGHDAIITCLCPLSDSSFASSDTSGKVMVYDLTEDIWTKEIHNLNKTKEEVVDLAYSKEKNTLIILYKKNLFVYDLNKNEVLETFENKKNNKNYKYVKLDKDGHIRVSYEFQPLVWYDTDGNICEENSKEKENLFFIARENPKKDQFAYTRSPFFLMIKEKVDEAWTYNQSLLEKHLEVIEEKIDKGIKINDDCHLYIYLNGEESTSTIYDICYSDDGKRILVSIYNHLLEFDTEKFDLIKYKKITGINQCAYLNDKIIISIFRKIYILDSDFNFIKEIKGSNKVNISKAIRDYFSEGYYIRDSHGEVKKLDQNFRIQAIRNIYNYNLISWCKDRINGKIKLMVQGPDVRAYDFEKDDFLELGKHYHFLEEDEFCKPKVRSVFKSNITSYIYDDDFKEVTFENYTGIYIYKCSFKNIKGSIVQNKGFIISYGGEI